ncbi:MAG: hypothetical protein ACI9G1_001405, partial [Pirellulaceae bacterium]
CLVEASKLPCLDDPNGRKTHRVIIGIYST